jgi:hypothetical protein
MKVSNEGTASILGQGKYESSIGSTIHGKLDISMMW